MHTAWNFSYVNTHGNEIINFINDSDCDILGPADPTHFVKVAVMCKRRGMIRRAYFVLHDI